MPRRRWWSPKEYAKRRPILAMRSAVLAAIREYFSIQGFVEVETAALQVSPGIDRHIRPIRAEISGAFGAKPQERFLHTSPEFSMKKLLAAGETKIFQTCHAYRDGEEGHLHHPEFTLLEWYRTGETYEALVEDVKKVIQCAADAAGVIDLRHRSLVADPRANWARMTVAEAFQRFSGIDVLEVLDDADNPSVGLFVEAARGAGVRCDESDGWDDVFNRVMLEHVEPALADGPPAILNDYPAPVGALARPKQDDPRVCERVEAYVCGVELANGFSELTDPIEQRRRFERDRQVYQALYGSPAPIDEDFLEALAEMPEAAGMALGIDRLMMLITGTDHIRDVLWAPVDMTS